jgi:hypothetical protein
VTFAAGSAAGATQCVITVPQELLKIRLQVTPSPLHFFLLACKMLGASSDGLREKVLLHPPRM